jgi:hypothetical protein
VGFFFNLLRTKSNKNLYFISFNITKCPYAIHIPNDRIKKKKGNISEFREYRYNLLKKDMIAYLRQLLADDNETISFLASRVLVNVVSSELWLCDYEILVEEIRNAIDKLHENKRINFNLSLNTILILLGSNDDICVYWACSTLAYLTKNEFEKYGSAISNCQFHVLVTGLLGFQNREYLIKSRNLENQIRQRPIKTRKRNQISLFF